MFKRIGVLLLAAVMFFTLSTVTSATAVISNCSGTGLVCSQVTISKGDQFGYSGVITVPAGSTIWYGAYTYDDSLFQMGATLYEVTSLNPQTFTQRGTQIIVSGGGGTNLKSYTTTTGGQFFVKLESGDASQGRSHGTAYLEYYY